MGFVRTREGDLISLIDVRKIYALNHEGGGCTVMAVMRANDELVELARDYNIDCLAKVLDPVRASR
jgi:hypothetical protein